MPRDARHAQQIRLNAAAVRAADERLRAKHRLEYEGYLGQEKRARGITPAPSKRSTKDPIRALAERAESRND